MRVFRFLPRLCHRSTLHCAPRADAPSATLLLLALAIAATPAAAAPFGAGQLRIEGTRLTLYADELTTDADQTVDVGERARVRTCFGGIEAGCGSVLAGDPRVAGLVVRAELRGPELPRAVELETVPGGSFMLPGFHQEGDYSLENIRLVDGVSGEVLSMAQPSVAILHVRQILLAHAMVRTLSLEDLRLRGIELDHENFQGFTFAVGFAFGEEIVELELPLVYDGFGNLIELERPEVKLDGLPQHTAHVVERWQPPRLVPFKLEPAPKGESYELRGEEDEGLHLPVFGAIVLPGTLSYLNQFFEAELVVANGAAAGSGAELHGLGAQLRLPGDRSLRMVASDPWVAPGQEVPISRVDGGRTLYPGEQGSATWVVEGLRAGTHALQIDVTGDLLRPGREPLPVLSRVQAAVEVVDARFNLTFSHPDVVREGEDYSLFVTVTNLSPATQNLITLELRPEQLTGAVAAVAGDTLQRTIETLAPGQAETVELRLTALLNGKVVATTFQASSSAGSGTIRLRTGVGELGIPLSPATLVMPRFSDRLESPWVPQGDLLRAQVRLLGLAYSLASAPPALTPQGLPRVIRSDVERRAIDLAQAGHRIALGEAVLESLEILALDLLGNRHPLAEYDELRRRLDKGRAAAAELATALRHEQAERGLGAVDLLDHLAATASYTQPFLAALLIPDGEDSPLELEVRQPFTTGWGRLVGGADGTSHERNLPYGEILQVSQLADGAQRVPLVLVGHVVPGGPVEVLLRNPGTSATGGRLHLLLADGEGGDFRRVDLGHVTLDSGAVASVPVATSTPDGELRLRDAENGSALGSPSVRAVLRPPFRLIGALQDFRIDERERFGNLFRPNRYGNGIVYLFNRPPDATIGEAPDAFHFRSHFSGLDTAGAPATGTAEKIGTAAWAQDDARVVAVRYSTPISSLIDPATGDSLLQHEHLVDELAIVDQWGERLDPATPPLTLEKVPLHVGGLVGGRVVRGTGEPAGDTRVTMARLWKFESPLGESKWIPEIVGEVTTAADGEFFFDFVETPHWDAAVEDRFILRAHVPQGADPELEPAVVEQVSSRIRLQNRVTRINIALLGRGAITGRLVYEDGEAVADGRVTATSTLFSEMKTATVAADGSFRLGGLPVGPMTLTGRDPSGRVVHATVGIERPGDVIDTTLTLLRQPPPGLGTVQGTVLRFSDGSPVEGARVALTGSGGGLGTRTTDAAGRFRFEQVPEGRVTLQAAVWSVSRTSALTDLRLAPGETAEVTLRLSDGDSRAVTGHVYLHDPFSNSNLPIEGAVAFIPGPGAFAYTDATGRYRIEGVPVQGLSGDGYRVQAIDYERRLEGGVQLPPIDDTSPPEVAAQPIVLAEMTGTVDGIVLDPLGRPLGGVEVVLFPIAKAVSRADGSFTFENVRVGNHTVKAHIGDGLQPGRLGYFGQSDVRVVYGGHRPFVSVRMVGGGTVRVKTRTSTSTGVLSPIYYKPTWYHEGSWTIKVKGSYIETSTDPNGDLEVAFPVGDYVIVAYNPFHGMKTVSGKIRYPGQAEQVEIVFEDAATVTGQVVDVDGHTPVPGVEVVLEAKGLKPQRQLADAQGNFRFELVPKGRVTVTAAGAVGTVERRGRTFGYVGTAGQVLDLVVEMKAQGTVRGRVLERFNGEDRPLPFTQFAVQENSFPHRRLPEDGSWLVTDEAGIYELSHVFAGGVTVLARDSQQVSRKGSARGTLEHDWQVLEMPDIVMTTSVGLLEVVVRDPATGGPVADAQVRLSNGEETVTDAAGLAIFDALPLKGYSLYAFYAPTGQSGRLANLLLSSPGQRLARTIYLDQRGEVRGTVWDDAARTVPVAGAVVRLDGKTSGGRLTALASTSGLPESLGRFELLGIPEGAFDLEAAVLESPRRAYAQAALTETAPFVDLHLVLEPVGSVHFELREKLQAGVSPVDLSTTLFNVRLSQGSAYDYLLAEPTAGSHLFGFDQVLLGRRGSVSASELVGERRTGSATFSRFDGPAPVAGSGSEVDPYQLVLRPKGVVRINVFDGSGSPLAGANVTLNASGTRFPSVTGADGTVTFGAVPSGGLTASASSLTTGTGGTAKGTLTYDDEVVELSVHLAPSVAAHGTVYGPVPGDVWNGDPGLLLPAAGVIVEIRDAKNQTQLVLTDEAGGYRFDVLPTGAFTLAVRTDNGEQTARLSGTLVGPDGFDNPLPAVILDAAPPRILSLVPPTGMEGVSRSATVEILFSELLDAAVTPGEWNNPNTYYSLRSASGQAAAGRWTSVVDASGGHLVRFTPSTPYGNETTYSLVLKGGSGGIRDRAGRPLSSSGNIGSNFRTSDSVGPEVVGTVPTLERPVDPALPLRIDFSEAVAPTDEQLDGDGVGDAVEISFERSSGESSEWVRLPLTLYVTRSNYSLMAEVVGGVSLDGDTSRRRLVVRGLRDVHGNLMPDFEATYRIYDGRAPVVEAVPYPANAPDGQLLQGDRYTLVPVLSSLDEVTATNPGGDVDRVEYYFEDPTDPARPVAPSFAAQAHPFAYSFVGAYVGDGIAPRPFPIWVRAVDTSTNASNVVRVEMVVLPNNDPRIESVALHAEAPVVGVFYAGSTLVATVSGIEDSDDIQLTLFAELWDESTSTLLGSTSGRLVTRPPGGWADLTSQTFTFTLPIDLPEGDVLTARARALDPDGAVGEAVSEAVAVADDATPPVVEELSARLAGAPVTTLFIGEEAWIEVRAFDGETAVRSLAATLDRTDLFPEPLTLTPVAGAPDVYRSQVLRMPAGITEPTPVTVTLSVEDHGDNVTETATTFDVAPERDPEAPTARWLSPRPGSPWPAAYTSVLSPDGAALLLRAEARDITLDADGHPIPGRLVSVEMRGPVWNADAGGLEMAPDWIEARLVPGSETIAGASYEILWRVPNGIPEGVDVPFEIRMTDPAGTVAVSRVTMTAVPARRVYEGAITSAAPGDPMLDTEGREEGLVFLLDGTTLSLVPAADSVRRLAGLVLYTGASTQSGSFELQPSVLTAPEITSYDSAILYHPLEVEIESLLLVGLESRIDMTARGLLGSTSTRSMVLPGEVGASRLAGGSHGGEGGYGSPSGGWNRTNLNPPGSVFDSLRDPMLPGGGGASSGSAAGGAGGGVVRLLAPEAVVRLDGDVVADGGAGSGGGGAGGAIRIVARRLEGKGRLSAGGGPGSHYNSTGGGGGGRIAVSAAELATEVDLAAQSNASGGHNHAANAASAVRQGGAGTVFVEDLTTGETRVRVANEGSWQPTLTWLPALGDTEVLVVDPAEGTVAVARGRTSGSVVGDLLVVSRNDGAMLGSWEIVGQVRVADASSTDGYRTVLTVAASVEELEALVAELALGPVRAHGRSRLGTIEAAGQVRMVADDDLELGPSVAPSLNDRTHVTLSGAARALLRGEGSVVSFVTTPEPGAEVLLGSTVEVAWEVNAPLGLGATAEEWSLTGATDAAAYYDQRTVADGGPVLTLPIALDTPPGEVVYRVEATDLAGRSVAAEAAWSVADSAAPTVAIRLGDGVAAPVAAGYSFMVVVEAADREGLARITLEAGGPVAAASVSQSVTVGGIAASTTFTVEVLATADGSEPVELAATVEDATGLQAVATLSVPVAVNDAPQATLRLAPGSLATLEPGQSTALVVDASDVDGLATVELVAEGAVTEPVQQRVLAGTSASESFTLTAAEDASAGPVTVTASVTDALGSVTTTAPLLLEIVEATGQPSVTLALDPEQLSYLSGSTVAITARAFDEGSVTSLRLLIDGHEVATAESAELTHLWQAPPVAEARTATIEAIAIDDIGEQGTATRGVVIDPDPTDDPPAVAFACPSNGAILPLGYELPLQVAAVDDLELARVDLYLDGVLLTSVVPEAPTAEMFASAVALLPDVPATAVLRAEVFDNAGRRGVAEANVETVVTTDLFADGAGVNDWSTLVGEVAVLRGGTLTVDQPTELSGLIVLPGAALAHSATPAGEVRRLGLEVAGTVYVGCGGAIDVSGRGYGNWTYPGHQMPGSASGGSHLGVGGVNSNPPGETYGSVYFPQESGTGRNGRGGGVLRVVADRVLLDGVIRANGSDGGIGAAGGSIWMTTGLLAGSGAVEAMGGKRTASVSYGSGGGGAIAIEYEAVEPTSGILDRLTSRGGSVYHQGGAGTVYLHQTGVDTFGRLIVDNSTISGQRTVLPSLGSGVVQPGSSGTTLVTDRERTIPEYFVGHWVEVRDGASGDLRGTLRVAAVEEDGFTLAMVAGGDLSLEPGDLWQGVYRFDELTTNGDSLLISPDPIRVLGDQVVTGRLEISHVNAERLIVTSGAVITQHLTPSASESQSLVLEVGELVVEEGGAIDVSGRGYGNWTYPGHQMPGSASGGSHLGVGGVNSNPPGETYGSVYFPQESGTGRSGRGGGVLRVVADRVLLDGVIRANGSDGGIGAAGGSIWMTTGLLAGSGAVEAMGGKRTASVSYGSGGGGAIAIEYEAVEPTSGILDRLTSRGGSVYHQGGAGTVYLHQTGVDTFGRLIVDNSTISGQRTVLPSLGSGVVQPGSAGTTLVTDRERTIPEYFVGHWVEVRDGASGDLRGTLRVAAVEEDGFTLAMVAGGISHSSQVTCGRASTGSMMSCFVMGRE
jgi:hypothetical protein